MICRQDYRFHALKCYNFAWVTALAGLGPDKAGRQAKYLCPQVGLRLMFDKIEAYLTAEILKYLAQPTGRYAPFYAPDPQVVRNALQPGDILLIEGNSRLSATIKYLTQSTWSHAALYAGERPGDVSPHGEPNVLLGGRGRYRALTPCRCRNMSASTPGSPPRGRRRRQPDKGHRLRAPAPRYQVRFATYRRPGARPVPIPSGAGGFRRRTPSIGCGDPTRAICSNR